MSAWFDEHRLVHYTTSPEIVRSILDLGFLLVPNKRQLIHRFLPDEDFSRREPQEFGMVSFTELKIDEARQHRERFGAFGICVSWDWALRKSAQGVLYISEEGGAVFEAFKWLFRLGRQEVGRIRQEPDSFMLTNKSMAGGLGAEVYHAVLTLYEYMEPERNSSQVEWRIVQKIPAHHNSVSRAALVKEVLEAAKSWRDYAVQIEPDDVEMFVCEERDLAALRRALPDRFRDVPIHAYSGRQTRIRSILAAAHEQIARALRRRERIVYVPYTPPAGSVLLPKASDGTAVLLPRVSKLWGVALHPTVIDSDVSVSFQYEREDGELFELRMPARDAHQLLVYLGELHRLGWKPPNQ